MVRADLRGNLPVRSAIAVLQFYVWFVMDAVQVLVQTIQEEGQQLLGVLLLEAVEPWCILGYRPLESNRNIEEVTKP